MTTRLRLTSIAAVLALAASSHAQITGTYVDAVPADLPDGNTVQLSDLAPSDFYDGPTAAWPPLRQDKWFLFSGDTGIDATGQNKGISVEFALFASCCGFGTPPALLTTISGLEPDALHDVYVHFVAAPWIPGGYGIRAAFEGEALQLFTEIDNSTPTNLTGGGGLHTIEGLVGNTQAVNGEIKVEIHPSGQERSYYAGLSYVRTGSAVVPKNLDVALGDGPTLVFTWDSVTGKLYNLRSETDPSNGAPIAWPIVDSNADIPADPSGTNTLTIPLPADPERFFVIEDFPAPPVTLLSDDFENGQGGWTTGSDGLAGTAWELGAPSNVGPAAANSPDNCFATNISADYNFDADVWLRSPPIDLTTAGAATLNYFQFTDIEGSPFDWGKVSVLDATDDSLLAVIADPVEGSSGGWEAVSIAIPATALGKTIKIEFRLVSDDFPDSNYAGWYLDDVEVTVP